MNNDDFVLRDSRSNTGTNVTFWSKQGGYTTNLNEADVFTKDNAIRQHRCRETDIPLPKGVLASLSAQRVDMQYLPESLSPGLTEYVIQRKGDYNGNDIYFLNHTFGSSTNYSDAKVFTEEEALGLMSTNDYYQAHAKVDIDQIMRLSVHTNQFDNEKLANDSGIELIKPVLEKEKPMHCGHCGSFISAEIFYGGRCSKCEQRNY